MKKANHPPTAYGLTTLIQACLMKHHSQKLNALHVEDMFRDGTIGHRITLTYPDHRFEIHITGGERESAQTNESIEGNHPPWEHQKRAPE